MLCIAAAASVFLAVYDVKRRKIPNAALLPLMVFIFVAKGGFEGLPGLLDALMGAGLPFLLLWPFFCFRMMGAGDVKLMIVLGAACGWPGSLWLLLLSLAAGGLYAVFHFLIKKDGVRRFRYLADYIRKLLAAGADPGSYMAGTEDGTVPFAVFTAAGMLIYTFLQGGF
ncbi:MAG: A24 family peptidase [Lachnospiraceae bacterium]|nr:A24 family peptidase [Lachnospiraceae bacterium]